MAYLVSEVVERNQRILILEQNPSRVGDALKRKFNSAETELFVSAHPPHRLDQFDYIFTFNIDYAEELIHSATKTLIVLLFAGENAPDTVKSALKRSVHKESRKLIELSSDYASEADIERILWFAFSKSKEESLKLTTIAPREAKKLSNNSSFSFIHFFETILKPKKIILFIIVLALIAGAAPLPFLLTSAALSKSALESARKGEPETAQQSIENAKWAGDTAQILYSSVRPLYLLFSLAGFPDNVIAFNTQALTFWGTLNETEKDLNHFAQLVFTPNPTQNEQQDMTIMSDKLIDTIAGINSSSILLREKLSSSPLKSPELIDYLNQITLMTEKTSKIVPSLKTLFESTEEKKYLLLIANDQQLRPGGGVIEAYGWITIKNKTVEDIHVIDADTSTLIPSENTEVPSIFAKFGGVQNLSLADAAYSAHFPDNYARIRLMLEENNTDQNYVGSLLITRTGISRILKSSGELYLPKLKEKITGENVSIKAEIFKGDERFYQELFDQLRGSLRNTRAAPSILTTLVRLLDEKQIIVLFNDQAIQAPFDSLYWTGKIITPECILARPNCTIDSLFPLETNLGNNNINSYIVKHTKHKSTIRSDGGVAESIEVRLRNTATGFIPPSSLYKTYFQFLLPQDITVTSITKNNTLIEDVDSLSSQLTIIGMYIEIKPKEETVLRINYRLNKKIDIANGTYQVVLQKQAGSPNSDFSFELSLPHTLEATRYNFAPVVNGSKLNYNTVLNADKVFLIEFKKR